MPTSYEWINGYFLLVETKEKKAIEKEAKFSYNLSIEIRFLFEKKGNRYAKRFKR